MMTDMIIGHPGVTEEPTDEMTDQIGITTATQTVTETDAITDQIILPIHPLRPVTEDLDTEAKVETGIAEEIHRLLTEDLALLRHLQLLIFHLNSDFILCIQTEIEEEKMC